MKKILMPLIALMVFAGCDKIEPGNYTTGTSDTTSGGSGNWQSAYVQRALVEKYTGPKCPNCPKADVTLDAAHQKYGDKLIVISINHPVGQGEPFAGQPDMRTEAGTIWDNYYSVNAIPAAFINRNDDTPFSGSMENIISYIGETINNTPTCNIDVRATTVGDSIDITVDLELLTDLSIDLTLTLALTEDSLVYKQSMPNGDVQDDYVHNHMLREVFTNVWGDMIPLQGYAREHIVGSFRYAIPHTNPEIKLENSHIVAFVSEKESRGVINSAQCKIQ